MKLLLILLSVMTWTVTSKNNVTGEGEWPYDIEVAYANTYNKGQVRQGDTATLVLGKLGGITVEKIEVYVRSIASAGAGTFSLSLNGQTVATKSGTFRDWFGAYDNENYHALSLLSTKRDGVDRLSISLVGTTNSLYIEKYVITYAPVPARTVTLMKGAAVYATMSEESGMQGVTLPELPDSAEWKFVGWSAMELWTVYSLPTFYPANQKFYPSEDCTLWALYRFDDTPEMVYMTEPQTGDYMYVNRESGMALTGVPDNNGRMARAITDVLDENQRYRVRFVGTDTAYITHVKTGTPIGYLGTKMAAAASPWQVYHQNDETIFYATIKGKTYVLWLNIHDTSLQYHYAGLMEATPVNSPLALRVPREASGETIYTCHPEGGMDIVEVEADGEGRMTKGIWSFPFGPYRLIIQDGKKYLMLKE